MNMEEEPRSREDPKTHKGLCPTFANSLFPLYVVSTFRADAFRNWFRSSVSPSLPRESGFRGRTALRGLPRAERGEVHDLARSPKASRAVRRTSSAASTRIRAAVTATQSLTERRIDRRVGPFHAENPPEQAVTLARKMREASRR